ncbi:MAG: SUMF1/EgtB/PvdO family nonheme iron enzyme [Luteolibacter sp.]
MNPFPATPRRSFLKTIALGTAALSLPPPLWAVEDSSFVFDPKTNLILAPKDPALWPQFREQLAEWRAKQRHELNYSDALYQRPEFAWAPGSYACYVLMLCDERFYDAEAGRYLVKEWLAASQRDFGGFDSVVLWHAYPRIGLDDRNQFDFYRDQPGGLKGLREVVDELHRAGVRSYIDYNPWDLNTRRETKSDVDAICEMVAALGVDGIFLDTMKQGAADFRSKLDAVRPGVVLEGEIALPLERITDHHMEWGQGFVDSEVPGVVRNKWFERRHQLHHVHRWGRDRTAYFQTAFMNGTGTMIWDNVFGTWVGYSEREKSILRSMLPIQRRFTSLFAGERWTPLVPTNTADLYASLWEDEGVRLWTLVNRSTREVQGGLTVIELKTGEQLWDLVSGAEVKSASATIRPRGIGCFVAARRENLAGDFTAFLDRQRISNRDAIWDASFPASVQTKLKRVVPTRAVALAQPPKDMAVIPGGPFICSVRFRIRECGWYESTPDRIKNFSKLHSLANRDSDIVLAAYAMDLTPVTNAQFAEFLKASSYQPKVMANFLKHWRDGVPPVEQLDHPVVYVDLDDARAYAKWAGKRLPTEEEWQFAAQGTDGRPYPWGAQAPEPQGNLCNGFRASTTPVKEFPAGRSPFGIYDLCGNTWEWTESERADGVNRFAILRGGSYYQAHGSHWYMDGGPQEVSFGAKCLLAWPGIDRCATVGFRCVVDLETN